MKVITQKLETQVFLPAMTQEENSERLNIIHLVRRWGGLATDALLDPLCKYFRIPQIEGFIGYRTEYGCAVIYGDPVCDPKDAITLARAFHDSFHKQFNNIIYLTASENFAKSALNTICKSIVEYGEEVFLDPHCNPKERQGTHASLVRRKLRHAQNRGVEIIEYTSYDPLIEKSLENVASNWLKSRKGPQIHISRVHLFDDRPGKRWFYAQKDNEKIGTVVLNQLHSREGWHMNHLMLTPDAPNGTPELLVVSAIESLKSEDCSFVSFGVTPAEQLGTMIGLSKFSSWIARRVYHMASQMFHLKGHKMFWGKFHPETRPSYLIFSRPHIGVRETLALKRVMNASIY